MIRQEIQANDTLSHIGSTEFQYDLRNNLTKFSLEMGGRTLSQSYKYTAISGVDATTSYAKENLPVRYSITSNRYIDYSYDSLNRLNLKAFNLNNATVYTNYIYKSSERNEGTDQTYRTTQLNYEIIDNSSFRYYYDNVGNITQIKTGTRKTPNSSDYYINAEEFDYRSYEYDGLNQLVRENDFSQNKTFTYEYDNMGNILKRKEYAYTTDALGDAVNEIEYTYGNDGKTSWNKLLTSVDLDGDDVLDDNESITYDAIGNPTTYLGAKFSWFGRQLQTYKKGDLDISYTYDSAGLRGSKTIANGEKITYQYVGDVLYYQHTANADGTTNNEMYFYYDSYGKLSAIRYYVHTGTEIKEYTYYVLTNSFGDVLALYGGDGKPRVSYEYDTWGNVLKVYTYSYDTENNTVTKAECTDLNNFAHRNPFRYRSYYYDIETGLYYLQSRYYNPEIGRFLNADGYLTTGQGVLSYNMFAYCLNNPVNSSDPTGHWPKWLVGALNVVSGFAQMSLGAALGATVGWTGVGAVAAGLLLVNGAATATQGIGQIVNHVTKSKVLSEDNIVRTGVQSVGNAIAGEFGANAAGLLYDSAVMVADIYAGSVTRNIIPCCFIAGTIVLTASGNKNIEKIKVGDLVWSENPETNEKALKHVVQTFVRESYELVYVFIDDERIVTTPEHPFYVAKKGWVESIQLCAGDILVLQNGEYVIVEKIQHEILENPITVYNFEVADFHSYYVGLNGILVHNDCKSTSPNQMQQQVLRGQAPSSVTRVDNPKIGQPHIHFDDGTALNIDGSVHDAVNGVHKLTNDEKNGCLKMVGVVKVKIYADNRYNAISSNTSYVEIVCTKEEFDAYVIALMNWQEKINSYIENNRDSPKLGLTHMHYRDVVGLYGKCDSDIVVYVDLDKNNQDSTD